MVTYETLGEIRGSCGHRHRTLHGAVRCLRRDREGCADQGGYSDREVVRTGPAALTDEERDEVEVIMDDDGRW